MRRLRCQCAPTGALGLAQPAGAEQAHRLLQIGARRARLKQLAHAPFKRSRAMRLARWYRQTRAQSMAAGDKSTSTPVSMCDGEHPRRDAAMNDVKSSDEAIGMPARRNGRSHTSRQLAEATGHRVAGRLEQAIELYRRAVLLAPN